jgi:hypothetical protein
MPDYPIFFIFIRMIWWGALAAYIWLISKYEKVVNELVE